MTGEKIILGGFNFFGGKHCQSAAFRNILKYKGFDLSEKIKKCAAAEKKAFERLNN